MIVTMDVALRIGGGWCRDGGRAHTVTCCKRRWSVSVSMGEGGVGSLPSGAQLRVRNLRARTRRVTCHHLDAGLAWRPQQRTWRSRRVSSAICVLLFCSGQIALAVAAGCVFSFPVAALATWLGGVIGACIAFAISRNLLRGFFDRLCMQRYATVRELDRAIGRMGWRLVIIIRLVGLLYCQAWRIHLTQWKEFHMVVADTRRWRTSFLICHA